MTSPIRHPGNPARLGMGIAGALLICGPGAAQIRHVRAQVGLPPVMAQATPTADPVSDGLSGGGFYLEADTLTTDQDNHQVAARGGVEARYKGRVLRADAVDYDSGTGIVKAHGHVQILAQDGTAQFADDITLDKSLSDGFAVGFAARMQDNIQIAAATVTRRNATITEFDRVIYTPCPVCAAGGKSHPTWAIRARRVVEDKRRKILVFHDAVVEVAGFGVLYLPTLSTPDPSAKRKSGLLLPVLTIAGKRGFSYEQPYYQIISRSEDITVTPQFNSRVYPFLNVDWNRRFYSGALDVRAGYTNDRDFDSNGERFGAQTSRSYILASGAFRLSQAWQWGFTAERASDKLIFDKYSVPEVFIDRGLYAADSRRLISQIYAVRQDNHSYFSIATINVQGVRTGDDQSAFPTVAPLIEERWELPNAMLGGRLRIDASAVALTRDQPASGVISIDSRPVPRVDSRRATLQADWQTTYTLAGGLRLQPFVNGRADLYSLSNLTFGPSNTTIARAFGTVGFNISYPLIKTSPGVSYILEPLAQIAISSNSSLDPRVPNEDSVVFALDETNLFRVNRSPGYDLYQGGRSVTLGGRATAILADGRTGSLLFGRNLAASDDFLLPLSSGLSTALSDYILAADATPLRGIHIFSRLRLDAGTFAVNRLESGASFTTPRLSGYVSYLQADTSPTGAKVRSLDLRGEAFITRHWGVTSYAIIDSGAWRRRDLGIVYRDACVRAEIIYRHDETFNGTLGPSTSVLVRLTLATLGNTGYSR